MKVIFIAQNIENATVRKGGKTTRKRPIMMISLSLKNQ